MPTLTFSLNPTPLAVGLLPAPQLCYLLLKISALGEDGARPVNWALVADASRSMRIPIVDEHQFRALVREGGAQETLVDGVPVWQLSGPVPPDVRAASHSALDHVARALHSVVERLDGQDRFALVACAEEAVLLTRSASGAERVELVRGISRLKALNLGEQTDLARGIELGLNELRRGREAQGVPGRADRLLLLTDGFTRRPEACIALASAAAAEGVAISTVGLGGEFQEEVLTALADRSGGHALFLHKPEDIPRAITAELAAARAVAVRAVALHIAPADGVAVRRITCIRPTLTTLSEAADAEPSAHPADIPLGDIEAGSAVTLLLELLVPPDPNGIPAGRASLGRLALTSNGAPAADAELVAIYQAGAPPAHPDVLDAAARANAARLQRRALAATASGMPAEAARLLRAAAARLDDLGEHALADVARGQASALEQGGRTSPLATKELTYATRRLGEGKD
jgi:Ca-activated chloride channel family protein